MGERLSKSLMLAVAGPIVWFLLLSALYGVATFRCTPDIAQSGTSYGVVVVGAVVMATVLLLGSAALQLSALRTASFLPSVGLLLTGLSSVAIFWMALPVFTTAGCPALG